MQSSAGRIQVGPYVNFQGRAREAMAFYHGVLGGTLATDGHPDYPARVGDNMAIALGGTDRTRLAGIFHDLAEGGNVLAPLTAQGDGGETGWLRDRFGISWTVHVD